MAYSNEVFKRIAEDFSVKRRKAEEDADIRRLHADDGIDTEHEGSYI